MDNHSEDSLKLSQAIERLCKLVGVSYEPYCKIGSLNLVYKKLKNDWGEEVEINKRYTRR